MKTAVNRVRRRKKAPSDGSFFKKESQEPRFFSDIGMESFFQPAPVVQKKCTACEKEDQTSKGHANVVSEEIEKHPIADAPISMNEGDKAEGEPCTAGSLALTAETTAVYNKEAGILIGEKKVQSENCPTCKEDCIDGSGILSVKYKVDTDVALPSVPGDLTPCQQARVKTAIDGPLSAHEQMHVNAFKKFDGMVSIPIKYHGCGSGYDIYLEGLAEAEYQRRKNSADAQSAVLDPFSVPVDLCCKEPKPAKK